MIIRSVSSGVGTEVPQFMSAVGSKLLETALSNSTHEECLQCLEGLAAADSATMDYSTVTTEQQNSATIEALANVRINGGTL